MADRVKTRLRANFKKTSQKAGYSPDFTIEAEWSGQDFRGGEEDEQALYHWGQLITHARRRVFDEVNLLNRAEGYEPIRDHDLVKMDYTDGNISVHSERIEQEDESSE